MSLALYSRDRDEEWPLADGVRIGRLPECAICVGDPSVSRLHARVEAREDGLWIVDLGSSNGTRVNGRRVREAPLRPGDLLTVGSVALDVRGESPEAPRSRLEPQPARAPAGAPSPAEAERARLRAELKRLDRGRGLGDLGQLSFRYQLLAFLLGLAFLAAVAWGVLHLGDLLSRS